MNVRRYDLSMQVADTQISTGNMILILLGMSFVAGISLVWINSLLVFGVAGFAIIAALCIRWPYAALIAYMLMEYLRPMERYPVLAPLHLTRVIAVLAFAGWLIRRRKDGLGIWVKGPENAALFFFLAVAFATVPGAWWRSSAVETAMDITRTVMICILIVNLVNTPKRLAGFMLTFIGLHVFLSGEQLYHYMAGTPLPSQALLRVGSLSGSFLGEDGDFAMSMGVAMPFAFYLMWSRIKPYLRVLCGISVLMFAISIIATGSRGGAVGFLAVLLTIPLRSQKKLAAGALVLALLIVGWSAAPTAYKQRIATIANARGTDSTVNNRRMSWAAARRMYSDRPVLGVGVGNFYEAFAASYGGSYSLNRTVHSVYWQAAAEMGTFGIVAFVLLVIITLVRSGRLHERLIRAGKGTVPLTAFSAAVLPSMAAYLVSGAFQTPLYYPHMYLLAAFSLSFNNIARSELDDDIEMEKHSKWSRKSSQRG